MSRPNTVEIPVWLAVVACITLVAPVCLSTFAACRVETKQPITFTELPIMDQIAISTALGMARGELHPIDGVPSQRSCTDQIPGKCVIQGLLLGGLPWSDECYPKPRACHEWE